MQCAIASFHLAAAAAKSLQSCPTLRDPIDGSSPGSPVPGILQARVLEWGAIAFSSHSTSQPRFKGPGTKQRLNSRGLCLLGEGNPKAAKSYPHVHGEAAKDSPVSANTDSCPDQITTTTKTFCKSLCPNSAFKTFYTKLSTKKGERENPQPE